MKLITLTDEHGRLMGVNADEIAFFRESNDGRLSHVSMRSGRDLFSMQTPWKIAQLIQEANTAQDTNKDDVTSSLPEVTAVADATESPPWYPDDSGLWVEYQGQGIPVSSGIKVQILVRDDRVRREHVGTWSRPASHVNWSWINCMHGRRVVAYKVIGE